jgi:hypothetical protein
LLDLRTGCPGGKMPAVEGALFLNRSNASAIQG